MSQAPAPPAPKGPPTGPPSTASVSFVSAVAVDELYGSPFSIIRKRFASLKLHSIVFTNDLPSEQQEIVFAILSFVNESGQNVLDIEVICYDASFNGAMTQFGTRWRFGQQKGDYMYLLTNGESVTAHGEIPGADQQRLQAWFGVPDVWSIRPAFITALRTFQLDHMALFAKACKKTCRDRLERTRANDAFLGIVARFFIVTPLFQPSNYEPRCELNLTV